MKPKTIEIDVDYTRVTLQPDIDGGIFAATFKEEHYAGKEISITGIPPHDVAAIELGDLSVLSQYVPSDHEQPHVHRFVNCRGSLNLSPSRGFGMASFSEYAPQPTHIDISE